MPLSPVALLLFHSETNYATPRAPHPGIDVNTMDVVYGSFDVGGAATFQGQYWTRKRRNNAAKGRTGTRMMQIDPRLFLETRFPGLPYVLRVQDLVAGEHTAGVEEIMWGFGSWLDDVDRVNSLDLIGFHALSGGNWFAMVKDRDGTKLNVDTGIASNIVVHELRIDLDGSTQTVRFYIDGVQKASYQFVAPTVLGSFDGTAEHPKFGWAVWNETGGDGAIYVMGGASRSMVSVLPSAADTGTPAKPTLTVGEVGGTYADLSGSAYSHPNSVPHKFSVWQVDEVGGDFSTPVREVVDSQVPLTSARIGSLTPQTTYIARVLYMDEDFVAGAFSDAVAFSTDGQGGIVPLGAPDCADVTFTEVTG